MVADVAGAHVVGERRRPDAEMAQDLTNPTEDAPRILIAEDHLDSRDALQSLLEAFGYRVVVAANGREAVDRALAERPNLILMDIMMPELDGFEATRMLRTRAEAANIPIIAVTAMDGARQLSLEAGADDFLAKPVNAKTLLAKIRQWLTSS